MVQRGVDLAVGGGARDFTDQAFAGSDARVARSWDELAPALAEVRDHPTFGLLAPGALPYAIDRDARAPGLRDLARLALDALAGAPGGFCLFIENEGVDESAHANDAAALAREMIEAEETLELLLGFVAERDDTLLIATTDHACANPGFSAAGDAGDEALARLASASRSFDWIRDELGRLDEGERTAEALADLIDQATGARLDGFEVGALARALRGERVAPYRGRDRLTSVMGSILANHLGVAFTGRAHAADPVLVTATGPGADLVRAAGHHTDLHDAMTRALGLPDPGM
ncbi:MAG: hypothetical protein D6693_01660 [Planctomycetota bacterium]|nr:MAG: hypothetical protein D6693_01660 [Planctomycetota bacterium]